MNNTEHKKKNCILNCNLNIGENNRNSIISPNRSALLLIPNTMPSLNWTLNWLWKFWNLYCQTNLIHWFNRKTLKLIFCICCTSGVLWRAAWEESYYSVNMISLHWLGQDQCTLVGTDTALVGTDTSCSVPDWAGNQTKSGNPGQDLTGYLKRCLPGYLYFIPPD